MDRLIEHVGILVPNLEEGIERWSRATGYEFSPIARYRTSRYADLSDPEEHFHDARMSFSRQGPPRIELLEVTGSGTHGPDQLGIHHLGFTMQTDIDDHRAHLAELGFTDDGLSFDDEDRLILWFTDKKLTDGIRLEFVSNLPGRAVADDGSALPVNPETGRHSLWPLE